MGLVTSRRGKTGGWKLTRPPAEITLLNVVEGLEPEVLEPLPKANGESGAAVSRIWEEVREGSREILARNTLEKLASNTAPMFYI